MVAVKIAQIIIQTLSSMIRISNQVPNWRFGLAAHTFFAKDLEGVITPEDDHELYLTEDPAQAQRIINRYIEVDNWFQFVYTNDT